MGITRRGLLIGAAAGGGLLAAWYLYPRDFSAALPAGAQEQAFGAWLKIGTDGVVTVALPQLEMGQGVGTLLAQVIATELGADWRQMGLEPAPPSGAYANIPLAARWAPLWMPVAPGMADSPDDLLARRFAERTRFAATADGTALAAYETPCREAAASARAVLSMAAAQRWDIDWEQCEARGGFIVFEDRRASFGELEQEAALLDPPELPPLLAEPAAEEPIAGPAEAETAYPRLDLPAKVDGSLQFAGDVRLPGMVFAAIAHGQGADARLLRFDARAASRTSRLLQLVDGERWLAAVATDWWSASAALDAARPAFRTPAAADSEVMDDALEQALASGEAQTVFVRGDGYGDGGSADLSGRYSLAPGLAAPIETASATARLADGTLEIWAACQAPEAARQAAADAAGVSIADTVLYPMPAGGSFDARLDHAHVIAVAKLARLVERPVQLVYSRWQEQLTALPRPAALVQMNVRMAGDGGIAAMSTRIAMAPVMPQLGRRLFGGTTRTAARHDTANEADPLFLTAAAPQYAVRDAVVEHVPVSTALPAGRVRGNGHALAAFAMESFVDEAAASVRAEPLSYRIAMLDGDPRMVAVLQRAARLAGWNGGRSASEAGDANSAGQGLACFRIGSAEGGGRIACIAEARRDSGRTGGIAVSRIVAAVDIGRIVNLDIARQQIEGGLVFGQAMVTGASTRYEGGLPDNGRLAELSLPRLPDCPAIEVDFVDSQEPPADPGELGVAVAPPAIANALYAATGQRFRSLPLQIGGGIQSTRPQDAVPEPEGTGSQATGQENAEPAAVDEPEA